MSLAPMPDAAWLREEAARRKPARKESAPEIFAVPETVSAPEKSSAGISSNVAYTTRRAGKMNRTEAAYADRLAALRAAGEVDWFAYEGATFRLPGGIRWTPDFAVLRPGGRLELHEVKGRKGATYYATEKARLKLRLARETLPLPVFVVWPLANGAWAAEYRPPNPLP